MKTTTIGVFEKREDAESAILEVKNAGISDTDISYIYSSEGRIVKESSTGENVGDGAASGATTGAVVGAIAGLAVANGILPGLGTLFVAGPLATALGLTGGVATTVAGAVTGAAAGGIIGALTGLGVSEDEAKVYEEKIKSGGIVVTATSENGTSVKDIFQTHHADEIREYTV